ncbi:unnamed protein product [Mesocestoides corti]|uniref:Uncharacterized protein n=1 Tax=Mesocestoides corti TaxID=53468 RepID=A0A0R3U7T5_MESCO|nr:unnamed protein product [Mesocestoides corti]
MAQSAHETSALTSTEPFYVEYPQDSRIRVSTPVLMESPERTRVPIVRTRSSPRRATPSSIHRPPSLVYKSPSAPHWSSTSTQSSSSPIDTSTASDLRPQVMSRQVYNPRSQAAGDHATGGGRFIYVNPLVMKKYHRVEGSGGFDSCSTSGSSTLPHYHRHDGNSDSEV